MAAMRDLSISSKERDVDPCKVVAREKNPHPHPQYIMVGMGGLLIVVHRTRVFCSCRCWWWSLVVVLLGFLHWGFGGENVGETLGYVSVQSTLPGTYEYS